VITHFENGGRLAFYHGAWVIYTGWSWSAAFGNTIFLGRNPTEWLLNHEFGHTLQERMLGRLYIGVAVLSVVSFRLFPEYHHHMPWERWADQLIRDNIDPDHDVPPPLTWPEVRDMLGLSDNIGLTQEEFRAMPKAK